MCILMNFYCLCELEISFLFLKLNVAINLPSILYIFVLPEVAQSAETCYNE
jgi:hypothetical protein